MRRGTWVIGGVVLVGAVVGAGVVLGSGPVVTSAAERAAQREFEASSRRTDVKVLGSNEFATCAYVQLDDGYMAVVKDGRRWVIGRPGASYVGFDLDDIGTEADCLEVAREGTG